MASDAEPAKLLLPFLQRADELQKHEPLIAYYCRLYAMDRGLKIPQKERTKTTSALLVSLMNQLEKDKKALKLGPEDNLYVEGFASNVFAKADKQDRARRADLNTAKTFYAASIFFEVLNQFGELAPDIEQKLKYAVWKAADIRKALKEGRKPEPGPPGGDEDLFVSSVSQTDPKVLDSNESNQTKFSSGLSSGQPEQDLGRESLNYPGANLSSQPAHKDMGRSESFNSAGANVSSQPPHMDPGHNESFHHSTNVNPHVTPQASSSLSSYSSKDYSTNDYPQFPQPYSQNYHQTYSYEQQPSFAQNYPLENSNPTAYPNFQSYPSFQESSFPSAPTHQPSYYHGADVPYSQEPAAQYSNSTSAGNQVGSSVPPTTNYKYDSNYQPSVEKIAEAHKAARFAVGALAFDDVSVAVDFLRRSLELLTNPSAELP
ncbi:protein HOMOLOG OF MAMMALIAN LYST-INTERACTING PROTEIN 5 [Phalaenopsis equestris]|uniref:protein HOMOLOG OF MAMMALIAN LYST-INTERACTING PROTEIN 5 n=1 Tax=Phalaenopsis equestris TaxID=78828 RepID=UPI0009E5439F|nr:protein HOMOLOG OF MAMMALIAN LYST-INTERACTING PROTEIN 5 [Phalaenopsis equestris]